VESFFATLKKELIHPLGEVTNFFRWRERERALSIFKAYSNTIRAHSFLGYLSPLEFEKLKMEA
jgi:transposase InsO family protein